MTGSRPTPEQIGFRVQCVGCGRPGEVDDVTPTGLVIVRHDAVTWCVVPVVRADGVGVETWNARPPVSP